MTLKAKLIIGFTVLILLIGVAGFFLSFKIRIILENNIINNNVPQVVNVFSEIKNLTNLSIIISIILMIVGVFVALILNHIVILPLSILKKNIIDLNSNINIDNELEHKVKKNDDIGLLVEFFNKMRESLKKREQQLKSIIYEKGFVNEKLGYALKEAEETNKNYTALIRELTVKNATLKKTTEELNNLNQLNFERESELKRTFETLRINEEKLRIIFENVRDAFFIVDYDTETIIDCNYSALKLFDLTDKDYLLGKEITGLYVQSEREYVKSKIKASKISEFEIDAQISKFKTTPTHTTISEIQIDNKNILIAVIRDITDRKTAETELKKNIALFSAMLDSTAEGIMVSDLLDNVIRINNKYKQIMKLPDDVFDSLNIKKFDEYVFECLKNKEYFLNKNEEITLNPKIEFFDTLEFVDGRVIERYSQPQIVDGKTIGRIWCIHDITELVFQKTELEEREKILQFVVDQVSAQKDQLEIREKELIELNTELESQRAELETTNFNLERQQQALFNSNKELQATMKELSLTTRELADANREIKELNDKLEIKVADRTSELVYANTELSAMIKQLEQANLQLKETQETLIRTEKLASIGKFASAINHELRNPLGSIKNAHYLLKMKINKNQEFSGDAKVKQILDMIECDIDRCAKIISDILDFARQKKLNLKKIKIEELIENVLNSIEIAETVAIERQYAETPEIAVDCDQLFLAFTNIIQNAFQAMENKGLLKVITEYDKNRDIVKVIYIDNGQGISPENIKKIFEPLVTFKPKGTGMGLAIVKSIVDAHNGKISVSSEQGNGATFSFEFYVGENTI